MPGGIGEQTVIEEVHSESWVYVPGKVQRLSSPLRLWNRLRQKSHQEARRRFVDSLSNKSMSTGPPRMYLRATQADRSKKVVSPSQPVQVNGLFVAEATSRTSATDLLACLDRLRQSNRASRAGAP